MTGITIGDYHVAFHRYAQHFGRHVARIIVLTCFVITFTHGQQQDSGDQPRRPLSPESPTSAIERDLPPLKSPNHPVNCEVGGRYIDDAIARTARAKRTYLFAIVRLGRGESSARISEMRAMQVKAYLEYTRFPNYVVAVGDKVKGYGVVELYVAGELLYILPLRRNGDINLLSCVAP